MKEHSQRQKKIKVLMVGNYPPPYGGIAVVIRDLLESPLKNLCNIKFFRTTPRGSNNIHRFLNDIWRLIHILSKNHFDVFHIHTSYDWGWPKHVTYILITKILSPRTKIVLHMHAYDKKCKNRFPFIWFKKYLYPPKFVFKIVDGIIVLSEEVKRNIDKFLKENKIIRPTIVVSNGVLKNRFERACKKKFFDENKTKILFLSTLCKRKGIIELLNILKTLDTSGRYHIIIGGDGPYREEVEKMIKKLKNTIYLGRVSEEDKICLFKEADIFLLPSDNEGLPIAILEALAGGCGIITTRVGAIPEFLEEGKNAIFINPHREEELLDAILKLSNDKNLLGTMKKNNLTLSEKFSWEKKVYDIYQLYQYVLGENHAKE